MRAWLNNPRIVIPMAGFALLFLLFQYGMLDSSLNEIKKWIERPSVVISDTRDDELTVEDPFGDYTPGVWQPQHSSRYRALKRSLFFAGYENPVEELVALEAPELMDASTVIVDREEYESCFVQRLGLDQMGYFVVFENVLNQPIRKRVGDVIYLEGSGPLIIPTIGIAEIRGGREEFEQQAASIVAGFKLLGVGTEYIQDANVTSSQNAKNIAFIQDAHGETGIFKQGQLVHRNPHLGLDQVFKGADGDRVILVDPYGAEYELTSVTETQDMN